MTTLRLFLVTFFLCSMLSNSNAQTQTLTPELLWKLGRLSLNDVSPNGKLAVYGLKRYDVAANSGLNTLYLMDLSTGSARQLTAPEINASDAVFYPTGEKVGFLANGRLNEISIKDPNAQPVLIAELEMNGFKYSPDGRFILFAQDVKMGQSTADKYPDLPQSQGKVINSLFYRHWTSWRDDTYSNIFYAPYADGSFTAEPINIMNEAFDSPLKPLGGMEQINWSPDSRFIAYTSRKLAPTQEAQSTNSDIYVYELRSGRTINFTEDLPGYDIDPVFSPDGHYLLWTSMARPGYEADRTRCMLLDLFTQQRKELTAGWNYECNSPHWSADSKTIYFISATDFTYQLYKMDLSGKIAAITKGQHDYKSLFVAGDQLLASRVSMSDPEEAYLVNPKNGEQTRITFVTDDPWATIAKGKVERRSVRTTDGKDMNVWVVFPPNFDVRKKYPALLYCQGGPQSAVSQFFSYRWNLQLMAANGYIVIAPCRRGMPGSGQEWCDAIMNDWGGMPMEDLLAASDALAKEPWVDATRMGAVGASFGGYSVFWLAGHHEGRFKAFISHDGLFNLESFYGTTEEVWFPNNDFGGAYWQTPAPSSYEKFSPHRYVQNWDTPIMVVQGDLDFRVPTSEGLQAFQAAQLQGIPSKLLYFPNEGHWVTKPQNSILWQREFFDWLDTYLKP